jgi:phosphoribosylformylglycinamidine synthase
MCVARHVPLSRIGVVDSDELSFQGLFDVSVDELRETSERTLPALFD